MGEIDQISTNTSRYSTCCAVNVYIFVYIFIGTPIVHLNKYVLNVFIDIQTSEKLIQMDTDKMMTYGTFTMDDEKLTQS